jgi:hypothetical protein
MEKPVEKVAPAKVKSAAGNGKTKAPNGGSPGGEDALNPKVLLAGLRALQRGEFDARLPDDMSGVAGQICETFNELAQRAAPTAAWPWATPAEVGPTTWSG